MRASKSSWWPIPILLLFAVIPAFSQAPDGPGSTDPQNNTGVARVSFIHGDVSMQRGDSGDFSSVALNTPLVAGDKVATGAASRTELQLDYANILRLDRDAQATIATLDRNRIQVQVGQGLAHYSVLKGSEADVEIDTPNVSVHPLREGRYRVQVNPDGDTFVTVNEGEAQVSTSEGSTTVKKYQVIAVHGTGTEAQFKVSEARDSDDWDKWNRDRDNVIYNATGYRKTNRYYTGASDLDAYGTWSEVPDYGQVWVPRVDYGWAPYRTGHWVWEPYWGWTWVSYEPWGWAPYHYGRWFLWGGSWAWWPGPVYGGYRPIWAPAYVSFFGFGGGAGFSVGVGFGSIGWLPIGPCDYYHPWWGGYRERFGAVNVTNINVTNININNGIAPLHGGNQFSNVHSMLINERVRQGVSGVPAESFGRGTGIARTVGVSELRGGHMMTGNLPVVPTRDSLRVSERPVSPAVTSRMTAQRNFFSSTPAARPEPFSSQAARVNESIQRTGQFQAINGSRAAENPAANRPGFSGQSNVRQQPNAGPQANAAQVIRNPVQSQIRGGQAPEGQSQVPRAAQGANGWQRFGGERGASGGQPPAVQPQIRSNPPPEFRNNAPVTRESPNTNAGQPSGWQRFGGGRSGNSGQSPVAQPQIRSNSQPEFRNNAQVPRESPSANAAQPSGWQRFSSRPTGPGAAPNGGSSSPSGRPTLDMNKPIVNERSYRNNGDSYAGANRGGAAPAYRPAPNSAPSYSAPRNSAPSPNYRSYPSNPSQVYRSAPAPQSSGSGNYGGGSLGGGSYGGGGGARGGGGYQGGGVPREGGSSGGRSSGGSSRGR
jgi:FecR protein